MVERERERKWANTKIEKIYVGARLERFSGDGEMRRKSEGEGESGSWKSESSANQSMIRKFQCRQTDILRPDRPVRLPSLVNL